MKYRTRGQLVDEDYREMKSPHNPNSDPNEYEDDDDAGPTSLTINTRQFDENQNEHFQNYQNPENIDPTDPNSESH